MTDRGGIIRRSDQPATTTTSVRWMPPLWRSGGRTTGRCRRRSRCSPPRSSGSTAAVRTIAGFAVCHVRGTPSTRSARCNEAIFLRTGASSSRSIRAGSRDGQAFAPNSRAENGVCRVTVPLDCADRTNEPSGPSMCILREQYNKIIVTRWFDEYWGENYNEGVVAELASPAIRMVPSLHRTRAGHLDMRLFMSEYRAAFPDLCFRPVGDKIAE